MRWTRCLVCICACLISEIGVAQSPNENRVLMLGRGAFGCEQVLNYTTENGSPGGLAPWVYGSWSGMNLVRGANNGEDVSLDGAMVDPTDLQGWLFATCEQDLDQKIYSVAMEAYFEFSK